MLIDLTWDGEKYLKTIGENQAEIEVIKLEEVDGGLELVANYVCADGEKIPLDFMIIHLFQGCYGTDGNFEHFISQFSKNEVLNRYDNWFYGTADNIEQILEHHVDLVADPLNKYVLSVTLLLKEQEPKSGGWRWHKNGTYIGTLKPQCEHLRDEPEISEVLMYEFLQIA